MQPWGTKGMIRGERPKPPYTIPIPLKRFERDHLQSAVGLGADAIDNIYEPKGRLPIMPDTPYAKGGIWSMTDSGIGGSRLKMYPGLLYPLEGDTKQARLHGGHICEIRSGDVKWFNDEDGKPMLIFSDADRTIRCMSAEGFYKWQIPIPKYLPKPVDGTIRSFRIDPKRSIIANNYFVLLFSYCDWSIKAGQKDITFVFWFPEFDCPAQKWYWAKQELKFDSSDSFKIKTYKHCLMVVDLAKEKVDGTYTTPYSPPEGISGYSGYPGDIPIGTSGYSGVGKYAGDYARVVKIIDVFEEALCGPLALEVQVPGFGSKVRYAHHEWEYDFGKGANTYQELMFPFNPGGTYNRTVIPPIAADDGRALSYLTPQQIPTYCPGPPGGQSGPPCEHGLWWPHPVFNPNCYSNPGAALNYHRWNWTRQPAALGTYKEVPTFILDSRLPQEYISPILNGLTIIMHGNSWFYVSESYRATMGGYLYTDDSYPPFYWYYIAGHPSTDEMIEIFGGTWPKWKILRVVKSIPVNGYTFRREDVFEDCLSTDSTFSDITLFTESGSMTPAKLPGSLTSDPTLERKAVFLRWGPVDNDPKKVWPIDPVPEYGHCTCPQTGRIDDWRYIDEPDYEGLDPDIYATLPMPPPSMPDMLTRDKINMPRRLMKNNHPCLHRDAQLANKVNLCVYNIDQLKLEVQCTINLPDIALTNKETATTRAYPYNLWVHNEWPTRPFEFQSLYPHQDPQFGAADTYSPFYNEYLCAHEGKWKYAIHSGDTCVGSLYTKPMLGPEGWQYDMHIATGEGYEQNGRNQQIIIPLQLGTNKLGEGFFLSSLGRLDADVREINWYKPKPHTWMTETDKLDPYGIDNTGHITGWAVVDKAGTIKHSQNNLGIEGGLATDTYVRWAMYVPLKTEELVYLGTQRATYIPEDDGNGCPAYYEYFYEIICLNVITGIKRVIDSGYAILHSGATAIRIVGSDEQISDAVLVWSRGRYQHPDPNNYWQVKRSLSNGTLTKCIYAPRIRTPIPKFYQQMTYDGELLYATTSGPNGIMDVIDLDVFTILKTGESPYNQSSSGAPNLLIRRADSMQDELVATTKLRMYKYDANIPDGYSGISGYGYSGYSGDSGTSGT